MKEIILIPVFCFLFLSLKAQWNPDNRLDRKHQLYFRKSGLAFTNAILYDSTKIKFSGVYKFKYDDKNSVLLVFYPNGLFYRMSEKEFDSRNANKFAWAQYRIINDTILYFERDYKNTMGGKSYFIGMYKIINDNLIHEITGGLSIDETLSLQDNIAELVKKERNKISNHTSYYKFEKSDIMPDYRQCVWLQKKYFWANDSLYYDYTREIKNKMNE